MSIAILWALVKRFWVLIPIAIVLWYFVGLQRNNAKLTASLESANTRVEALRTANASMREVVAKQAQARVDNDAIADAVAAKLGTVKTRETNTQTIIKEAKQNDPVVRDWANVPVPDGVRRALESGGAVSAATR